VAVVEFPQACYDGLTVMSQRTRSAFVRVPACLLPPRLPAFLPPSCLSTLARAALLALFCMCDPHSPHVHSPHVTPSFLPLARPIAFVLTLPTPRVTNNYRYCRSHQSPAMIVYSNISRRFGHAATDRQAAYMPQAEVQALQVRASVWA
jgi:hypothetical protein